MSEYYPYYGYDNCAVIVKKPVLPMRETYSWLTDILTSFNGTEDRSPLRSKPRLAVTHKYEFTKAEKADVFNTVYGGVRKGWAVPLWQYAQKISTQSGSAISCDTSYPLKDREMVLIYVSDAVWRFADIHSSSLNVINISESIADLINPWLIPVKLGYINGDASLISTGHDGVIELSFRLNHSNTLTGIIPDQFNSKDLCFDQRLHGSGNTYKSNIFAEEYLADFNLGKINSITPWLNSKITQTQYAVNKGLNEFNTFLKWLYRREGRYLEYWRPSLEKDFRILSTGALTTSINVYRDSFTTWSLNRIHIVFQDKSGNWIPKTIINVIILDDTTMTLEWSGSIGIAAENIYRMCYLGLRRLNSDTINIDWIGDMVNKCELVDTEISA